MFIAFLLSISYQLRVCKNQMMSNMNNILIEAKPGIGKTTLLLTIADRIRHLKLGGFYTQEIRENNKRVGFKVETFSGQSGILSHIKFNTALKVGKYRIDIPSFERIGVKGLEVALSDSQIILIDEIGKMELFSERFKETLMQCFESDKKLIATIMSHSHPFVDELKKRSDVQIFKVRLENRHQLTSAIIKEIME